MYRRQHIFAVILCVCGTFLEAYQPLPGSRCAITSPHFDTASSISSSATTATILWGSSKNQEADEDEVVVELGSTEYMQGMLRRPVDAETDERVSGDKVLGPTLRLAGGVSGVLVVVVLAFLVSNGIVSF